jgi:hypothetical protein
MTLPPAREPRQRNPDTRQSSCGRSHRAGILCAVSLSRRLRRHGTTVRALLAVLAIALVLNGIAYLVHDHGIESVKGSLAHPELCSYCAAYGGLAGAPADLPRVLLAVPLPLLTALLIAAPLLRRHVTAARPRAPPAR